jgi:hypothetical protein
MKRVIFLFGLIGLVGCFLPLGFGMSFFELRHFADWTVYLMLAAYALPTIVGASKSESDGAAAMVGLASFGYLAYKVRTDVFDLLFHSSIGGIFMAVGLIGGLAASLIAVGASKR